MQNVPSYRVSYLSATFARCRIRLVYCSIRVDGMDKMDVLDDVDGTPRPPGWVD